MNKSVLITGITSGIGHEVCQQCLKEGFNVTGIIRHEAQKSLFPLEPTNQLTLYPADLSSRDQVKKLSQWLKDQEYDYVLLNAACADIGAFHQLPADSIYKIIETNLLSNMRIVHALLAKALERKTKFVFVSSLNAHLPGRNYASYAASKAALSHFYSCLRREYPSLPLLCIELGAVDTPLHEKSGSKAVNKAKFKSQEVIGKRLFNAMLAKTGVQTLSFDWGILRKLAKIRG